MRLCVNKKCENAWEWEWERINYGDREEVKKIYETKTLKGKENYSIERRKADAE